jgi:hypothetical protein
MKHFKFLSLGLLGLISFSLNTNAIYLHFEDQVEQRRIDQYYARLQRDQELAEKKIQYAIYNHQYNLNTEKIKARNRAEIEFYQQRNAEYQARERAFIQDIQQQTTNQRNLANFKRQELLRKIDPINLPNNNRHNYTVASQHANYATVGQSNNSSNNNPYNYSYYNTNRSTLQQWQQQSVHGSGRTSSNTGNQANNPLSQYTQYLNINGSSAISGGNNSNTFQANNNYYCPNNNYRCY